MQGDVIDYPNQDGDEGDVRPTISEVMELWEMSNLAYAWAQDWQVMTPEKLDRFRLLAERYAVDGALLLYVFQRYWLEQNTPESAEAQPADATQMFPKVGDLPNDQG